MGFINTDIKFHEGTREFDVVPKWARFFMQTGFNMPSDQRRRIIFISMPCESAAPGLITLGAMMSDLERTGANDRDLHKESLLTYAKQYLNQGRENPTLDGKIRKLNSSGRRPGTYRVLESTDFEAGQLELESKGIRYIPSDSGLMDYYLGGNPPTLNRYEGGSLNGIKYREILPNLSLFEQNLSNSFSGIILAGKNNEHCKRQYSTIGFESDSGKNTLASLLTIKGWSHEAGNSIQNISRVAFFNGMANKIDRVSNIQPRLVVADSDNLFHKVYASEDFRTSSIVTIIDRSNMDRSAIDSIRQKMVGLEDYYSEDNEFINNLTDVPSGISIRAFIK